MIKNATYTSVWDGGYEVTTNCKVNMETKEVFDIEESTVDISGRVTDEYITIDGIKYDVFNNVLCDIEQGAFWYYGDEFEEGDW